MKFYTMPQEKGQERGQETETLDEKAVGPALSVQQRSVALVSDTFVPRNLVELKELASFLAASDLIPKSLGGRKENVAIILMMGHEIGIPGVAALTNIYVVNGRPAIYGELATALVRRSGLVEKLSYTFEGEGQTLKCTAVGQRKGGTEAHCVVYTMRDALTAGLVLFDGTKLKGVEIYGKIKDTYVKNPRDMIMWKCLHRLFKFLWPDVLKGLMIREIAAEEIQEAEVIPQVVVEQPTQSTAKSIPEKRKPGRPKSTSPSTIIPELTPTEYPDTTVLTPEELEAKVEAAKARYNAAGTPPEAETLKEEYQDNGFFCFAPEKKEEMAKKKINSVKGVITRALRLSHPTTKVPMGFGIAIETQKGEKTVESVYMAESQEYAMGMRPLAAEKTPVELFFEPVETPVPSVKGKIIRYDVLKQGEKNED